MASQSAPESIDEYIGCFPADAQKRLQELRALIKAAAPEATETISYSMPTFDLNGRHLIHFAGYAKHIGLYPVPGDAAFDQELTPYKSAKSSARFPLAKPFPEALIRQIIEYRVAENARKTSE